MIEEVFQRHQKVAFEFSGGKDSLALSDMLFRYRDKLTVYWCNAGDPDPDTLRTVNFVRNRFPHFVIVTTDVFAFRKQFGNPSPIVPMNSDNRVIGDQICCMHNIMLPLHSKVIADGNTCIIRGQKDSDKHKGKLVNGQTHEGIEYIYPLAGNTDLEVMEYLERENIRAPAVYAYSKHGIDCLHCTGWWEHSHGAYLKDTYPLVWHTVSHDRETIKQAVLQELENVDR